MLDPITKRYTDHSTPDSFVFAFYCDRCGKEWRSETYAFNTDTFPPTMIEPVREMLWNRQHEEAYERANIEAGARFNRCPCCGCRVCDDCLMAAELEKDAKCRDCAKEAEP